MQIASSRLILGSAILAIGVAASPAIADELVLNKPLPTAPKASPGSADKALLIVTSDYIIGPEDVLEITVWKNADLSKQVQVRPDGRISLPLLGDISAVGKTPTQLTEEISAGLKAYVETPTISTSIKEVQSYQIYVLGEVNKPGKYPLKSKTTLLQGLTVAGGFTEVAARNKMVIFRFTKEGEGQTKLRASYDDIVVRDGAGQNIELKPGDQIVVPSETMVVLPSR
jgi:polysaccharide export outer membrane protein